MYGASVKVIHNVSDIVVTAKKYTFRNVSGYYLREICKE